jgi:hypothetical protein
MTCERKFKKKLEAKIRKWIASPYLDGSSVNRCFAIVSTFFSL